MSLYRAGARVPQEEGVAGELAHPDMRNQLRYQRAEELLDTFRERALPSSWRTSKLLSSITSEIALVGLGTDCPGQAWTTRFFARVNRYLSEGARHGREMYALGVAGYLDQNLEVRDLVMQVVEQMPEKFRKMISGKGFRSPEHGRRALGQARVRKLLRRADTPIATRAPSREIEQGTRLPGSLYWHEGGSSETALSRSFGLISRAYSFSDLSGRFELHSDILTGGGAPQVSLSELCEALDTVCDSSEERTHRRICIPGPETWVFREDEWVLQVECSGFYSPFGRNVNTFSYLENIQHQIELGKVNHAVVILSGPVDPSVVSLLAGRGPGDPGPFPLLEFRYELELPSGELADFLVKPAVGVPPQPLHRDPDLAGDQEFLEKLKHIHLDGREGDSFFFLFQPRVLHGVPTSRENEIDLLLQAGAEWTEQLHHLVERHENSYAVESCRRWLEPCFQDKTQFREFLLDETERLPRSTLFGGSERFQMSPAEREAFVDRILDDFHQRACEERERINREREEGTLDDLRAMGYREEEGGIQAPTATFLAEYREHELRQHHYCAVKSEQWNREVSLDEVPDTIGRRLDRPDWFLDVAAVTKSLREREPQRQAEALVFDPRDRTTEVVSGGSEIARVEDEVLSENLETMRELLEKRIAGVVPNSTLFDAAIAVDSAFFMNLGHFDEIDWIRWMVLPLQEAFDGAVRNVERKVRKLQGSTEKKQKKIHQNVPREDRQEAFARVGAEHRSARRKLEIEGLKVKRAYLELYRAMLPIEYGNNCKRLLYIRDSCRFLYLYVTRAADRSTWFHEEPVDRFTNKAKRTHLEAALGRGALMAGEAEWATHDKTFFRTEDWHAFDEEIGEHGLPELQPVRATDGSGHLRPPGSVLSLFPTLISPELR
ncbi:hypothetical protein MRY87_12435, partial [bacterium]|nr:hypothetical protein [bacterium]